MGLLDDLTAAAGSLDSSEQPSSNQIGPVLGALVHYTEHGDKFLQAAKEGPGAVSELLNDDATPKSSGSSSKPGKS